MTFLTRFYNDQAVDDAADRRQPGSREVLVPVSVQRRESGQLATSGLRGSRNRAAGAAPRNKRALASSAPKRRRCTTGTEAEAGRAFQRQIRCAAETR